MFVQTGPNLPVRRSDHSHAALPMSAHEPNTKGLNSISTTSQVHAMQHDAHVHHTGGESVPGRHVLDRRASKRHLLSNGSIGCGSR
eukprot:12885302-Prorocentrum_lima.AAC.1